MTKQAKTRARVAMGIQGLDSILGGGLPEGRVFLIHGGPGTGKTTTSFHFLRNGAQANERVLEAYLGPGGAALAKKYQNRRRKKQDA